MENKVFNATIDKGNYKKVKGNSFFCNQLKRELIIHTDLDNSNFTSISDVNTGYRLFGFPHKIENVTENQINQKINDYIKHYTIDLINKEFQKIELINKKENENND